MRAKRIILILIALAGAALPGCMSEGPAQDHWYDPQSNSGFCMVPTEPGDAARADARADYERAYQLLVDGDEAAAAERFSVWLDLHGDVEQPLTPRARYWQGYCREKLGQAEEAITSYRRVVRDHPATRPAELAARRLRSLGAADQAGP